MSPLDWIRTQEKEMIANTETWARINSHSFNLQGLFEMEKALVESFSPHCDDVTTLELDPVETFDKRGEIHTKTLGKLLSFKKRPKAKKQLLFVGHMDTVYPIDHPFQHVITTPDKIHGPGTADMKGGLAMILTLIQTLDEETGFEVIITPDEEIGSPGSTAYLQEAAKRADIGLVFEPALPDGSIVSTRPGSATYRIACQGISAHVGRDPEKGRSAIYALSELVCMIYTLKRGLINVGTIHGGEALNSIADHCQIGLNFRTGDLEELKWLEAESLKLSKEIEKRHQVSINWISNSFRPPKGISERLFEAAKEAAKSLSIPINFKPTGGVCDGNILFASGLPNLDTLGPIGHHLHSPDEFLEVPSLMQRTLLTREIVELFDFSHSSLN